MQYEKRYRQAVMSESIVVYQVNFSKDLIEEEFSQRTEEAPHYRQPDTLIANFCFLFLFDCCCQLLAFLHQF